MPLRLIETTDEIRPIIERLLQLYLHDISEFSSTEPCDGQYFYKDWQSYWSDPSFKPFVFVLRGKPAGFVLIRKKQFQVGEFQHQICDLFVLRCYRRLGIGEEVARMVFNQFPGRWEIEVSGQNDVAKLFWRQVMRRYTLRRYKELHASTMNGIVFEFNSPPFSSPWEN